MKLRQTLLDLSVVVTESAWLFAGGTILSILFLTQGGRLSYLIVLACYGLSFYVGRVLRRLQLPLRLLQAVGGLAGFLTVLALLALKFGDFGLATILAPTGEEGQGMQVGRAEVAALLVLVATWWRGGTLGQEPADFDTAFRSFRIGLFVVLVALLADISQHGAYDSQAAVVPFFSGALLGLALGHLKRVDQAAEQPVPRTWIVMLAVMVGGLLLLSLLLGLVPRSWFLFALRPVVGFLGWFADTVLRTILLGVGYIALLIITIGNWFVSLVYREPKRRPEDLDRLREDLLRYREQAEEGVLIPAWLQTLGEGLIILAVAGLILWLFMRMIQRRWMLARVGEGETRESVWEHGALGAELGAVVSALAARFRRHSLGRWKGLELMDRSQRERFLAVARLYYAMLALARSQGRERADAQTPFEFQRRLADLPLAPQAARITEAFVCARYGLRLPDEVELRSLSADFETVRLWEAGSEGRA